MMVETVLILREKKTSKICHGKKGT